MALIYNGVVCNTIEQLEAEIVNLSEDQKNFIRNDFNGITNAPVVSITDVTARQIRVALFLSMGMTEADIDAAINTLPDPDKTVAMIEWKQSNMFERGRPIVAQIGAILGKTPAELDALWLYARTL